MIGHPAFYLLLCCKAVIDKIFISLVIDSRPDSESHALSVFKVPETWGDYCSVTILKFLLLMLLIVKPGTKKTKQTKLSIFKDGFLFFQTFLGRSIHQLHWKP